MEEFEFEVLEFVEEYYDNDANEYGELSEEDLEEME